MFDLQEEIDQRRAKDRAQYAAKKLAETGEAVRSYVRGRSDAEKHERKMEQQRKRRGTVKLTPEQRAEIAREKARLRKQKSRAKHAKSIAPGIALCDSAANPE